MRPSERTSFLRPRLLLVIGVVVLGALAVSAWLVVPSLSRGTASSVTGENIKQVLLDGSELTTLLDQPLTTLSASATSDGPEAMEDTSSPGECAGVIAVAPKSVYKSAGVRGYTQQTWTDADPNRATSRQAPVMFVKQAAIALPSAADARALFARFAEQWQRCDGQPVNTASPESEPSAQQSSTAMHITDVRVITDVLAASVVVDSSPKAPDTRALGVQGSCIVEVLIAFDGAHGGDTADDPQTSSIRAVQAMRDKIRRMG